MLLYFYGLVEDIILQRAKHGELQGKDKQQTIHDVLSFLPACLAEKWLYTAAYRYQKEVTTIEGIVDPLLEKAKEIEEKAAIPPRDNHLVTIEFFEDLLSLPQYHKAVKDENDLIVELLPLADLTALKAREKVVKITDPLTGCVYEGRIDQLSLYPLLLLIHALQAEIEEVINGGIFWKKPLHLTEAKMEVSGFSSSTIPWSVVINPKSWAQEDRTIRFSPSGLDIDKELTPVIIPERYSEALKLYPSLLVTVMKTAALQGRKIQATDVSGDHECSVLRIGEFTRNSGWEDLGAIVIFETQAKTAAGIYKAVEELEEKLEDYGITSLAFLPCLETQKKAENLLKQLKKNNPGGFFPVVVKDAQQHQKLGE